MSEGREPGQRQRALGQGRSLVLAAVVAAAFLGRAGFVQSVHVSQVNMAPTLDRDDRVLVTAFGKQPGPGDVVAYRSPFALDGLSDGLADASSDGIRVGRIVAAEGSRVELDFGGLRVDDVLVAGVSGGCEAAVAGSKGACPAGAGAACADDGNPTDLVAAEALGGHCYFTRRAGNFTALMFPQTTVPPGHVFILNDNRVDERDSRIYGPIPVSAVVGVASFVYYATDQTGIRWDRMTRRVS